MQYQLRKPVSVIGRDPRSDIPLPGDMQVSKMHAEIRREGAYFIIYDLNSTNGTFVNGRRVNRQVLKDGDEIRVGRTKLTFQRGTLISPGIIVPAKPARAGFPWALVGGVAAILIVLVLILSVSIAPPRIAPQEIAPFSPLETSPLAPPIEMAQRATVFVGTMVGEEYVSFGSGSIIDGRGLVLTNFHVVGDLWTGVPYSDGLALVGVTTDPAAPPSPWYIAELVKWDADLDLAVLRIIADEKGDPIAGRLNLPTVPVGNPDHLRTGDELWILGYPGTGEDTISVTYGHLSGWTYDRAFDAKLIKTDAEISEGNSGGMAINAKGEMIGIPTWVVQEELGPGKLGYIIPINLTIPLIKSARAQLGP